MNASKKLFWASAALMAYILLFVWLGFYAFPQADDYAFLNYTRDHGFWGAQVLWYMTWTGRIANTFVVTLFDCFDSVGAFFTIYPLLPAIWIVLAFFATALFVSTAAPSLHRRGVIGASIFFTALWLNQTPALNEILYWLPGAPYLLSCVLILTEAALMIRALRQKRASVETAALCVLAFFNASMIEFGAVFQLAMFAAGAIWCRVAGGDYARRMAHPVCALIAAAAGLAAEYFAPGTAKRLAIGSYAPWYANSLVGILKTAAQGGILTTAEALLMPMKYAILLMLPDIAAVCPKLELPGAIQKHINIKLALLLTAFASFAFQALMGYSLGGVMPPRGDAVVHWMIWFCWLAYFAFLYDRKRAAHIRSFRVYRYRYAVIAILMLLSVNTRGLALSLSLGGASRSENLECKELLESSRDSGGLLTLPLPEAHPPILFWQSFSLGIENWANKAMAEYYGLKDLCGLPRELYDGGMREAPSDAEIIEWLNTKRYGDDDEAIFMLARAYDAGWWNTEIDTARAKALYELAASNGSYKAVRALTRVYLYDPRYEKDYVSGAKYAVLYIIHRFILGSGMGAGN